MDQEREPLAIQILRACITSIQKTRSNAAEADLLVQLEDEESADLVMKIAQTYLSNINSGNAGNMDAMNAVMYLKTKPTFGAMLALEMTDRGIDLAYWEDPTALLTASRVIQTLEMVQDIDEPEQGDQV